MGWILRHFKSHKVDHIEYLGVWISNNLLWSKHIIDMHCAKMPERNWALCTKFSTNIRPQPHLGSYTFLSFVLSLNMPAQCAHQTTAVAALEKVQKFAARLCSKNWSHSCDYTSLLRLCNLPTLESRRLYLKLCYLYQVINGNFVFPSAPLVRRTLPPGLRDGFYTVPETNLQHKRSLILLLS